MKSEMRASMMLCSFLAVSASGQALADVYAYTDSTGVEHYTNQAGLEGYQLVVAVMAAVVEPNRAEARPDTGAVAEFASHVEAAAVKYNVDKALVHAVITAESGYNRDAVSRVGAQGLMQLMPGTARRYSVSDAFDPEQNINAGTRYLRDLLDLFGNNPELAVAAYNAGEGAVIKHGRKIPPYKETMLYVPKVLSLYNKFKTRL